MATQYIGDAGPDGTVVARTSADKLGFYGKAPIVRANVTLTTSDTTGNFRIDVDAIFTALVNLGLI